MNGLFAWLLEALSFDVTKLSARDVKDDGSVGPAYDHLALQVFCPADPTEASAPWLVDVGWGDSFCEPLRLDQPGIVVPEGLRAYRIDQEDGYRFPFQRSYAGAWTPHYRFTRQPRSLAEFELTCRYHQTSPKSSFTRNRIFSSR